MSSLQGNVSGSGRLTGNVSVGQKAAEIDSTLTQAGKAADAKATGDALGQLSKEIDELKENGTGTGSNGQDGKDGISPIATVTEREDGVEISITDVNGTTTAKIYNGKDGSDGQDGKDGYTPIKGTDYFDGEKGDKGDKGDTGATGSAGKDGVSVTHSWNGTTLSITSASGTSSANLKGEKGDTGAKGDKGDKGDAGANGSDYVLTVADKEEIAGFAEETLKQYIDEQLGVIENGTY